MSEPCCSRTACPELLFNVELDTRFQSLSFSNKNAPTVPPPPPMTVLSDTTLNFELLWMVSALSPLLWK